MHRFAVEIEHTALSGARVIRVYYLRAASIRTVGSLALVQAERDGLVDPRVKNVYQVQD